MCSPYRLHPDNDAWDYDKSYDADDDKYIEEQQDKEEDVQSVSGRSPNNIQ